MIETAENLASDFSISREAADAYAVRSQQRAAAAWSGGLFDDEIVPVEIPQRKGDPVVFDRDEGRAPGHYARIARCVAPDHAGGHRHRGQRRAANDAAAACLVVAEDRLDELGLEPIAFFDSWAAVGCEPSRMGIGPVGAAHKVLERAGIGFDDLDLIEVNEAFAVQVLAVL